MAKSKKQDNQKRGIKQEKSEDPRETRKIRASTPHGYTPVHAWLSGPSLPLGFFSKLSTVPYGNNPYSRVLNLIEEPIRSHNHFTEREVREFRDSPAGFRKPFQACDR